MNKKDDFEAAWGLLETRKIGNVRSLQIFRPHTFTLLNYLSTK